MIAVIVLIDQLIWRPVIAWADKFKMEQVESAGRFRIADFAFPPKLAAAHASDAEDAGALGRASLSLRSPSITTNTRFTCARRGGAGCCVGPPAASCWA